MNEIKGKDFMIYFEYDTGNGIINLPYCSAASVTLTTSNDLLETTKESNSSWRTWKYGYYNYTLDIDGLVNYTLQEVQKILLSAIGGYVTDNEGNFIQVGDNNLPPDSIGYNDIESRFLNGLSVKWIMKDQSNDYKYYSGEAVIKETALSVVVDDFLKGSIQMQGQGKYNVINLPAPDNLQYLGQSDASVDDADFTLYDSSVLNGITISRYVITRSPLMNNYFQLSFSGDANGIINRYYKPGESYSDVLTDMANDINNNSGLLCSAYYDGSYLSVSRSASISITPLYIKTNVTVKNASFSFQTSTGFSGYTFKIINNTDSETYYVESTGKSAEIPLATGKNYTVSVMGYNSNGLMSDYSQPLTINF